MILMQMSYLFEKNQFKSQNFKHVSIIDFEYFKQIEKFVLDRGIWTESCIFRPHLLLQKMHQLHASFYFDVHVSRAIFYYVDVV